MHKVSRFFDYFALAKGIKQRKLRQTILKYGISKKITFWSIGLQCGGHDFLDHALYM
jgi:hypothetical protein